MSFGWEIAPIPERVFAAARVDAGVVYYVGLAVVIAVLVATLIAFYRTWMEIHEDEEPDSPRDLLESFREAHAAGQIDDQELERVRRLLLAGEGEAAGVRPPRRATGPESAGENAEAREGDPDSIEAKGTEPRLI